MQKVKIDWKEIWKEFKKLLTCYHYFGYGTWRDEKILLFSVINLHLPVKDRLDEFGVDDIEIDFQKWLKKNEVNLDEWRDEKKMLMKLVEDEVNSYYGIYPEKNLKRNLSRSLQR